MKAARPVHNIIYGHIKAREQGASNNACHRWHFYINAEKVKMVVKAREGRNPKMRMPPIIRDIYLQSPISVGMPGTLPQHAAQSRHTISNNKGVLLAQLRASLWVLKLYFAALVWGMLRNAGYVGDGSGDGSAAGMVCGGLWVRLIRKFLEKNSTSKNRAIRGWRANLCLPLSKIWVIIGM